MRHPASFLRLVPLAAAAFASVATSPMQPGAYQVIAQTPGLDESDVPADVVPEVQLDPEGSEPGDAPAALELHDADTQQAVAGASERTDENGVVILRFHPAAPLAPGHYELRVSADSECGVPTYADLTYCRPEDGSADQNRVVGRFSTVSEPEILAVTGLYGATGFTVFFSQDVDPGTVDLVHPRDFDRKTLASTRTWQPGGTRVLEVSTSPTVVDLQIDDGVVALDGTPVPGLPAVFP
jgi:hypothetical protein